MKKPLNLILNTLFLSILAMTLSSCATGKNDVASVFAPDRSQEGLTGPGIRMSDSSTCNTDLGRMDHISNSDFGPAKYDAGNTGPVEGIDFFQYKKKF